MTPIFDELMDKFFPEKIEFELEPGYEAALRTLAWYKGVPFELLVQDVVLDYIRERL